MVRDKRNYQDILIEILELLKDSNHPIIKTNIVYRTNINFTLLRNYINFSLENKLLKVVNNNNYQITEKGLRYLEKAKELKSVLES